MNHYIQLKKSNCKNCYKCIRHCPVKSIRFADHQAHIVKEQCILCGECFIACPQNAKQIRNDVAIAKSMIESGKPVYASIAPSFIANYCHTDRNAMEEALKKLGFAGVEETALGATVVKQQYDHMIRNGEAKVIISSCCHTVNSLIQKYYPEALPYLAKVLSPMQAHCMKLKEEHPDCYTVFLGPCISKKEEADLYPSIVDCVLTFEELSEWMKEADVTISPSSVAETPEEEGRARLFPVPGGIIRSMLPPDKNYDYIAVDGISNCIKALTNVINGNLTNCFIEMSACAGSCIGGPAMDKENRMFITDTIRINHFAREKDFQVSCPGAGKLEKQFSYHGFNQLIPGSSAINEILHKMGKSSSEQELNCGSCGYNTCREKAIAVYQGKADLTMCLPFLKEKAENFSDNIIFNMPNGVIVLNEELEVQQINRAAKQILDITHKGEILGEQVMRILNPTSYLQVMTSGRNFHDKLTYLEDYQKYVEETIIYDKTYHIIISIMKDVTLEERSRLKKEQINKQTIEITDKVIEKQMRVVQEIASLLGETTAETKIALTNLKETLKNESSLY
ncbi:MAG TPA: [Fe-Fe] hydrogenase large subunit C-terminal domain-containing protein [Mobilitalea sp.]|nr:[Fe-Fe] hydrogenase large subunit C-terminal domain-containing protein [Mobilitalea sp.]